MVKPMPAIGLLISQTMIGAMTYAPRSAIPIIIVVAAKMMVKPKLRKLKLSFYLVNLFFRINVLGWVRELKFRIFISTSNLKSLNKKQLVG
jgi:hypothetical protein